jgi:hypothetical protein
MIIKIVFLCTGVNFFKLLLSNLNKELYKMINIKLIHEEHHFNCLKNEFTIHQVIFLKPFVNISVKGS